MGYSRIACVSSSCRATANSSPSCVTLSTSASWLNAVEGFFAKLTKRRLKRGAFCSIVDLQAAINRFLKETNDHPKPFVWTADPDKNHRRRQTWVPNVRFDPLDPGSISTACSKSRRASCHL